MKVKAFGVALHFFDSTAGTSGRGSDKYYRQYIYPEYVAGITTYKVIKHWGRDYTSGQTREESFATWAEAKEAVERQAFSKIKKGYEYLGEAEISIDTGALDAAGTKLLATTGRRPTKHGGVSGGFALVIKEEPDLIDLLMGARA